MKYLLVIAMLIAQQGGTIFIMECVRRDLFLAVGVTSLVGIAAYLLVWFLQRRIIGRKRGA